jgi:outer membrane protein assembly factor BamB
MPAARAGPRATPAVDGGRVYAPGATGVLLCPGATTGKKVWQQDLLQLAGSGCPRHGSGGSPRVVGDRLSVEPGGPKATSVAALNRKDGRVAWQALDDPIGRGSPIGAEVGGAGQVIFFTGAGAVAVGSGRDGAGCGGAIEVNIVAIAPPRGYPQPPESQPTPEGAPIWERSVKSMESPGMLSELPGVCVAWPGKEGRYAERSGSRLEAV